jgi:GNAT superfamily N-acetyltransferase
MIIIDLLKNHPEAIPALAKIWLRVLGQPWMPHVSSTEITTWLSEWLNNDVLPLALIALDGDKPVGMCSLQVNDGIRPDLLPWLGDLCVAPEYQNRGIGKQLVHAAIGKVRAMEFESLYLFIFEDSLGAYYHKQGWSKIGDDVYQGHPVIVMEFELQNNQ